MTEVFMCLQTDTECYFIRLLIIFVDVVNGNTSGCWSISGTHKSIPQCYKLPPEDQYMLIHSWKTNAGKPRISKRGCLVPSHFTN